MTYEFGRRGRPREIKVYKEGEIIIREENNFIFSYTKDSIVGVGDKIVLNVD